MQQLKSVGGVALTITANAIKSPRQSRWNHFDSYGFSRNRKPSSPWRLPRWVFQRGKSESAKEVPQQLQVWERDAVLTKVRSGQRWAPEDMRENWRGEAKNTWIIFSKHFQHSFFPHATALWNTLPSAITSAPSLSVFKHYLHSLFLWAQVLY